MIDTFLAKVTYVAPAAYDAQGHLRTEATIKLDVYATKNSTAATPLTLTNGEDAYPYAVGDYVLLNAFTNAVNSATESGLIKTGADKYGEIVSNTGTTSSTMLLALSMMMLSISSSMRLATPPRTTPGSSTSIAT